MNAAQDAAKRIREGMAAPLAIAITAREYGTSKKAIALDLVERRRAALRRTRQPAWLPGGSWWDK